MAGRCDLEVLDDSVLARLLDLTPVGAVGVSFGSQTVLRALGLDRRLVSSDHQGARSISMTRPVIRHESAARVPKHSRPAKQ